MNSTHADPRYPQVIAIVFNQLIVAAHEKGALSRALGFGVSGPV